MSASLWAARGVTPGGLESGVRMVIEAGRIAALESASEPAPGDETFPDATLLPGLVDLQVNGGDGGSYDAEPAAERARATAYHLARGTTGLLAALVTAPLESLQAALERLAPECSDDGPLLGVHLEGPFLCAEKAGAHAQQWLCDPSPAAVEGLLARAGGRLRMVTLAPELPGAERAITRFAEAGAVVAAGHSLASHECMRGAIDAGLSFVTHVGNASDWPSRRFDETRGFRRSEPGLVGSFLIERRLAGSLILDGFHLHPALAGAIVALRGADQVVLVSDATAAAGLPPGRQRLGATELEIHAGGYATADGGLAGSVVTLLDTLRVAVESAGISMADAVSMAATTPARVIGCGDRKGTLRPGADADLLLVDEAWQVRAVFQRGRRV